MPVYPCRNCKKSVDPQLDAFCKNCNEKHPFECSKCGTKLNPEGIYELSSITFQKPLFCEACGMANKVVECKICGKTLVRSQGRITGVGAFERIYHPVCYDKQLKNVAMIRKYVMPVLAFVGALAFCSYSPYLIPIGVVVGGALAFGVAHLLTPR